MQKYDVGARNPGSYEKWIEEEGVPIHEALIGVEDVAELSREAWPRMGGRGHNGGQGIREIREVKGWGNFHVSTIVETSK